MGRNGKASQICLPGANWEACTGFAGAGAGASREYAANIGPGAGAYAGADTGAYAGASTGV